MDNLPKKNISHYLHNRYNDLTSWRSKITADGSSI